MFGRYIHTHKFDQAGARAWCWTCATRRVTSTRPSPRKARSTSGSRPRPRASTTSPRPSSSRNGAPCRVLSSQSRLEKIVADVLLDMATKPRLMDGHGNAMLVAGSIFEACKFYELFAKSEEGKCAIVTSYAPTWPMPGETTGSGDTDNPSKYQIYGQMLSDWFNEPMDKAITKAETFEQAVKKKFIDEPGQMKLLIGGQAADGLRCPVGHHLYIDKQMRDHGLFQAICRVNRLDGDDKEYGYIIDYKDLFKRLENAVDD